MLEGRLRRSMVESPLGLQNPAYSLDVPGALPRGFAGLTKVIVLFPFCFVSSSLPDKYEMNVLSIKTLKINGA